MKPPYYIASCSFGKDSIATILLALQNDEPLDEVVFCEVMFDSLLDISGELPEHIDFIYNIAIPKLKKLGVKKITILRSGKDFLDMFYHVRSRGKHAGMINGFPMALGCFINSTLKVKPIKEYITNLSTKYDVRQYLGIAKDEERRFKVLGDTKISLLVKYGLSEKDALRMASSYGLLSPYYDYVKRGGAGFVRI